MKYCDEASCPHFNVAADGICDIGFNPYFHAPKSMADVVRSNWGYSIPSPCRKIKGWQRTQQTSTTERLVTLRVGGK